MSQRIKDTFSKAKAAKKPVFLAYVTAGFPTSKDTVPLLLALQEGGVDIIEVGVPHSDPIGDGNVIQTASNVALEGGMTVAICLAQIKEARAKGLTVPIVLMGYTNPYFIYGEEKLIRDAKEAGADGFIVVDYPPEAAQGFIKCCADNQMTFIPLVAPTTSDERMKIIDSAADTFIYCVSTLGVTGERASISAELPQFVARIRKNISKPIVVGFGVSTREIKDQVAQIADGVVVGSTFIKTIQAADPSNLYQVVKEKAIYFTKDTPNVELAPTELPAAGPLKLTEDPSSIFGRFGGTYVPETLMSALQELSTAYDQAKADPSFQDEVKSYYTYVGRPTPLYFAKRLTELTGGAQIWLKREDLNHTGAHKINNAIGQALLAKRMGKTRIIAETGAGQHGVATATICAKMGLECVVYMGAVDIQRQALNVYKMKILGATVIPVTSGSQTLKDAINEAMRDWVTNIRNTHYLVGSAIGPHPFPTIVRDFQSVIGNETKTQSVAAFGRLPDAVVACVGGGSNAIGMFYPFVNDKETAIYGVEASGHGRETDQHCCTIGKGEIGVLHGTRTLLLQDADGQIAGTHSVSAGLDYPGVGPEHSWLHESGRGKYVDCDDKQALEGFYALTKAEGIIPALESSHAIHFSISLAKQMKKEQIIVVNLSGRGDKDMNTVATLEGVSLQ